MNGSLTVKTDLRNSMLWNAVILGSDAHRPEDVWVPETELRALSLVNKYSLHLIDKVELRRI